jgi:hypothetical protein
MRSAVGVGPGGGTIAPGLVAASPDAPSPVMFFGQVAAGDQVEQAFDLGDGAMWAFYRQPMPRCAVAACARASQGAALRSRDVSLAQAGVLFMRA